MIRETRRQFVPARQLSADVRFEKVNEYDFVYRAHVDRSFVAMFFFANLISIYININMVSVRALP